ncbi:ABC transporter substrate-binding protein [Paenibacillus nasutitermitis]|uniref:ABC transporter substrate-binding protein n=1 Tax=Paenibacillus nasutitermitis TaxID=1652958 RepID=A0A917DUF6_9BACL|nr:extracellular solute-binding protein [Paenibacillus nasutitermitis]GGD72075.1 ABC transporter substrate-binding protein [Paenibacillus nasutitermitis]
MRKKWEKKLWVLCCLSIVTALALAGCANNEKTDDNQKAGANKPAVNGNAADNGGNEPNDQKPVNLRITTQIFTPTEDKTPTEATPTPRVALDKIIEDFQKENPSIKVEVVKAPSSSQDEYLTWMTTKIASGDAPDIAWPTDQPQGWAEKGWLLPVDSFMDQPNPYFDETTKWIDTFTNHELIQKFNNGSRYTIPIMQAAGASTTFYYNIDIFEKLNLPVPKTWKQLVDAATAIKEAGYVPIIPSVENKGPTMWQLGSVSVPVLTNKFINDFNYTGAQSPGDMKGDEFIRAINKGIISQDKPEVQEVWKQYKAFAQTWPQGWATQDMKPLWREGKAAIREGGMWELSEELSDTKRTFRWGVFPIPVLGSDSTPYASDYPKEKGFPKNMQAMFNLAIVKPTVEKKGSTDAAVKFLHYLTKVDVNEYMVNEIPAGRPTVQGAASLPVFDAIQETETAVFPEINLGMNVWFNAEANDAIRRNVTTWITNKMDDKEFFANIQKAFDNGVKKVIESDGIDTSKW